MHLPLHSSTKVRQRKQGRRKTNHIIYPSIIGDPLAAEASGWSVGCGPRQGRKPRSGAGDTNAIELGRGPGM